MNQTTTSMPQGTNDGSENVIEKLCADVAVQRARLSAQIAEQYVKLNGSADRVRKEASERIATLQAQREQAQTDFLTGAAAHLGVLDAHYDLLKARTRPRLDDASERADEEMARLKARIADAYGQVAAQHRAYLEQLRAEKVTLESAVANANAGMRDDLQKQADAIDQRIEQATARVHAAHQAHEDALRQSLADLQAQADAIDEGIEQALASANERVRHDLQAQADAIDERIERATARTEAAYRAREAALRQSIADLHAARLDARASELARIDERLKRQEAELAGAEARVRAEQAVLMK